jgi:hypothetical protein
MDAIGLLYLVRQCADSLRNSRIRAIRAGVNALGSAHMARAYRAGLRALA